jgi:hypothetical protein
VLSDREAGTRSGAGLAKPRLRLRNAWLSSGSLSGHPFHFLARRWQGVEDVKQAGNFAFAAAGVWAFNEIKVGAVVV